MSTAVHLLGRPSIKRTSHGGAYQFRSRKSWAVLAYLLLSDRPPSRSQLAGLLFDEADDPIRALRWSLAEVRRGVGEGSSVDGDPVVLRLADDVVVDVDVLTHGTWEQAVTLPGLGAELLEGSPIRGAPVFETWLLSRRRQFAAASEAILHEAALGSMSRGQTDRAIDYAVRAATMSPLDENHQALLIRLYRRSGDQAAATRQYDACRQTWARELGVAPGPAVDFALQEELPRSREAVDDDSIAATLEAGVAAVSAGATSSGLSSLRAAAQLSDRATSSRLRVRARLALAEALIHSLRGHDEEGLAIAHRAGEIAQEHGLRVEVAEARTELGFVDFLRGRYDRAEQWLTEALNLATGSPGPEARIMTYLGCTASDRASYPEATAWLEGAVERARTAGSAHSEAYALAMLGRISLLRGDLTTAIERLDTAIGLAERRLWLAFLPWPQALRGEAQLALGEADAAAPLLHQAFARACQLGDPCWEALSARGIALVAEAHGDPARAFEILADARARSTRLADPYAWVEVHVLDAMCELGVRHGHDQTRTWMLAMRERASRSGMRELLVRSMLHGAALGDDGDLATARLLAADIDNPALHGLLSASVA
ncbi:MAG: BTAD domain-containing putative transcriptional regulator [Aeromicrobium sp.]